MKELTLVLGNKAYSSWSLRAWLALKATGAPFREVLIPLNQPDTRQQILAYSPTGKVPALKSGELTVWESMAILDYLAERFPEAGLWPAESHDRALARSVSAEMHAGFADLRQAMPMDLKRRHPGRDRSPQVLNDIDRITRLWRECRSLYKNAGPFLFGRFCNADAMYAPVATRFRTYGVDLDPVCQAYADALFALPAMMEWIAAAEAEPWVIENH